MVCIVTGATGCLGINLTKRLIEDGREVIALGRNEQLGEIITQLGAKFIAFDLKDKSKLKNIMQNGQTIFHCAALSSPWGRYKDFYEANVLGTQHVIETTPQNSRLIHVSSPSIYFNFTEQHNIKEDMVLPQKPANYYVKTKFLAEILVDRAYQRNLNVITVRPRAIFGPYDRAILPRVLKNEKNGVVPIIGNGTNVIDITYVENVVESLLLAGQADQQFCGKKYNITNNEPKTLLTILQYLFQVLQKPFNPKFIPYSVGQIYATCLETIFSLPFISKEPPLTKYSAAVFGLGQTLNIDAAKKDLGYQPKITINEGIERFAHWYQTS